MFRAASDIDAERTAAKVRELVSNWESSTDSWFDGSVESIDNRLAQCKKFANVCREATMRLMNHRDGIRYAAITTDLDIDRRSLEAMRRDLLTAATDRKGWSEVSEHEEPPICECGRHYVAPGFSHEDWEKLMASGGRHQANRWIELEARSFLADNEDAADDISELRTRAAHYAQLKTSALSPDVSRAVVARFVDKVGALGKRLPRRTASVQPTALQDFPSELIYIP